MKILAAGDLHLGCRGWGLVDRIKDHAAVLSQILKYARIYLNHGDILILAGDCFDSPSPDSYSCHAFAEFVRAARSFTNVIALVGNHDRERLDLGYSRVTSLGALGVGDGPIQHVPWRMRAIDWMPAAPLAIQLAAIPDGELDFLFLHQACEGILPAIAEPEVRLEQLRNKAKLVIIGDVHVNRTVYAGDTTVVSCGSTERCSLDQDPFKVVKLIEYDVEERRVESITDLPLVTRPIERRELLTEDDVQTAINRMHMGVDYGGDCEMAPLMPLVIADHLPALADQLPRLEEAARATGFLLVTRQLPADVTPGDSFVANRDSADREMEDIIATRHPDDAERAAALALWRNPENSELILTNLE